MAELTAIMNELQRTYAGQDGGYFVQINCSAGGTEAADNRLANGKFAVGKIGALRTGLDDGARELTTVPESKCPPAPLATAAAGAVTAREVIDAITAAGLPARNPRDNSANCNPAPGCVQLITTDDVSAYQFPDDALATRMASSNLFVGYQSGPIVLAFHNTDTPDPRYRDVLTQLMAH